MEWLRWQHEMAIGKGRFSRIPIFGDYTIQHAMYREPVKYPHVSASIRYTTPDYWIVYRGEWLGKKNGSGSSQYPAQAQLLVERKEYSGPKFSFGDAFIMQKALDGSEPGNPEQWLTAGINHHVTLTVLQLRNQWEAEKREALAVPAKAVILR